MVVNPQVNLILGRMRKLRLSQRDLAELATLHEDTVGRVLAGRSPDPLSSTLTKIDAALTAAELELRNYLVARHGAPDVARVAA